MTDITLNRVFRAALRRATIGNIYDTHTRDYRINYHFYIHLFSINIWFYSESC